MSTCIPGEVLEGIVWIKRGYTRNVHLTLVKDIDNLTPPQSNNLYTSMQAS